MYFPTDGEALLRRWQRRDVRRYREDVVVGQLLHRLLHQLSIRPVSESIFHQIQLASDIDRMKTRNPRHVTQTLQRIPVTNGTGDGLAVPAVIDQGFAF